MTAMHAGVDLEDIGQSDIHTSCLSCFKKLMKWSEIAAYGVRACLMGKIPASHNVAATPTITAEATSLMMAS